MTAAADPLAHLGEPVPHVPLRFRSHHDEIEAALRWAYEQSAVPEEPGFAAPLPERVTWEGLENAADAETPPVTMPAWLGLALFAAGVACLGAASAAAIVFGALP
jgi:hypothetical protein